ncbi:hypothetical protein V1517DRAFT_357184 [Lipomyces orientalis]|uniref:Uncharacterized protein n=1 Tax=Lipomyces orientalis TaxID=1233043 RepID=A0ACC3TER6_9ASCO
MIQSPGDAQFVSFPISKKILRSAHVIPKKVYPAAVRYMEYMRTKERKGGLIEHGLGDWGRDIVFGKSQAYIEIAAYHEYLKCVEIMPSELSLLDEAERFKQWAAHYPQRDRTAVDQAIALQFGLVPAKYRDDVMKAFLDDVADGRMRSGEIGLRYIFSTLDGGGRPDLVRPDLVLKMARQEEHHSYSVGRQQF